MRDAECGLQGGRVLARFDGGDGLAGHADVLGEMTQAQLAEHIGMTRQTVAAIEAGKYSPSLEAAFRIAQVFGAPLGEVFQWIG